MSMPENALDQTATSFTNSFEDFLTARCEQVMTEQVMPDPEYCRLRDERKRAAENLTGFLSESQKQYYYTLDSADGMSLNLAINIVYKQGLKDGLRLRGILGME